MTIETLDSLPNNAVLRADLVIVGAGACGLTLASELGGRGLDIVVLESGVFGEDDAHAALNQVSISADSWKPQERTFRGSHHGTLAPMWRDADQPYGLRCRGLGGSTQAWAGKSAPFDAIDYEPRPWVPLSGWPFQAATLAPYITRAEAVLNLGPAHYDETLLRVIGRSDPKPRITGETFRTIFWQFARSTRNPTEIKRFGADYAADPPAGVRVYLDATVTKLRVSPDGTRFQSLEVQSLSGRHCRIEAKTCVLAASTIENARLLLLSDDVHPNGIGNEHDQVGRHLIDHPTAAIARFRAEDAGALAARFGFLGHRSGGATHLYMRGLAITDTLQRKDQLLNGAIFFTEERAIDDPFGALSRLLRRRSTSVLQDLAFVARSPVRVGRGLAVRLLESGKLPAWMTRSVVNFALRYFPNTVANQVQSGALPYKFSGLRVDATTEQPPNPDYRVTLSETRDALGQRLPHVHWSAGDAARRNLLRMGTLLSAEFERSGLPKPDLADWVIDDDPAAGTVIDMGHSMGTTRMSETSETGVVDPDCQVHGVDGLFLAGGSVVPTSGHSNPTLMFLALTLRLSDHLAARLGANPK